MKAQEIFIVTIAGIASAYVLRKVFIRLQLSVAKHPSLRGHSKWSRRIAKILPFFEYDKAEYFSTDGAPEHIANKRYEGLLRLQSAVKSQCKKTLACSESLENSISDVRFTSQYRVPFPYRTHLPKEFKLGSIIEESQGTKIKDMDGNWRHDLSGSYGVNVFGYDFYKKCMANGFEKVSKLGPVLGSYHPLIEDNVTQIKRISGLDEVSFHMSGTEAVMQAVRLARYHTGKTHLVRLCGAYHGWWDGVQPGVGNKRKVNDVYTLNDLSQKTLTVLNSRSDIACVLINPMQAFHPNGDTSSDATLIASERSTHFDKEKYTKWLEGIREICSSRNIVLIFDEVFTGFRLSYRGAQGYFNIQADMVTYGKTLGGGLPVGVLAGKHELMKRFKDNHPANVSFARGTFNSHPHVMACMNEFLNEIKKPDFQKQYIQQENIWNQRTALFNQRLKEADIPVQINNMHSVLSILFTQPCRYNWMLQFYIRNNGLELSWIGTGRMIMSFNFSDQEFDEVIHNFIQACLQMKKDGWWWNHNYISNKRIKRQFLYDLLTSNFPILKHALTSPLNIIKINTSSNINGNHSQQITNSNIMKKAG